MKKLKKLKLIVNCELINDSEMKAIVGGYTAYPKSCDNLYISQCGGSCYTEGIAGQQDVGICEVFPAPPIQICMCVPQEGG